MNKIQKWVLAVLALAFVTIQARADVTDISGVITEIGTYKDAAIALAILIFLFVLGRRVVAKLVK